MSMWSKHVFPWCDNSRSFVAVDQPAILAPALSRPRVVPADMKRKSGKDTPTLPAWKGLIARQHKQGVHFYSAWYISDVDDLR
jgi:hypothetical protein